MKSILFSLSLILLTGCDSLVSNTDQLNKDGSRTTTRIAVTTVFDSHSALAKGANHITDKTAGTTLTGVDQTTSSSNIVAIINAAANAAVAVKTP